MVEYINKDPLDFSEKRPISKTKMALTTLAVCAVGYGLFSINKDTPERQPVNYEKAFSYVIDNMEGNPGYANRLLQKSIGVLEQTDSLSKDSYSCMFNRVRSRMEQNPEQVKQLGGNAQEYMKELYAAPVKNSPKDTIQEGESLERTVDSLQNDLQ